MPAPSGDTGEYNCHKEEKHQSHDERTVSANSTLKARQGDQRNHHLFALFIWGLSLLDTLTNTSIHFCQAYPKIPNASNDGADASRQSGSGDCGATNCATNKRASPTNCGPT